MRYPLYYKSIATFVAVKSGSWQDHTTWAIRGVDDELYSDGYIPEYGNPVEVDGYTVTLSANAACSSIDEIDNVLPGSYQLTVGGVDQFLNSIDQISGCTFLADLQDDSTYIESGGIVERVINKQSIGVTFPTLVVNGDFASGTTSWTPLGSATLTSSGSGGIRITNAATNGSANQIISGLTVGKRYRVKASLVSMGTAPTCTFTVRSNPSNTTLATQVSTSPVDFYLTFIASETAVEVRLINGVTTAGVYSEWDNVELYEVDSCLQTDLTKRPQKATASDGKKYLLFDGSNDFLFGIGNAVVDTGFTKVATIEWDDTAATLATNHILSSLVNNQHVLGIVKTNSTTARFTDSLTTAANFDVLLTTLKGQRVTIIETWGSGTKTLYLNGVAVVTTAESQTITDQSFLVGAFNNGAASTHYKGKIFEFATYNTKHSSDDVLKIDGIQERKFRVPQGDYITVAGAGESVSIGINSPISDPMIDDEAGLNYWPSLNLFRIANDVNGDSYSESQTGSQVPYLCQRVFSETGRPVLYVQTGKSGTTISSTSDSGSGNWSSSGTQRINSVSWIRKMLRASRRTKLDWLIFNLGENDVIYMNSNPGTWTKALFKADLQNYVTAMKDQFPGLKMILVKSMKQRNVSDVEIYAAQTQLVNEAQLEVSQENVDVYFATSPEGFTITNGKTRTDGQHYEKLGNQELGIESGTIIANHS